MTTPLWETDHPYYCTEGNYYQNGLHETFDTWADYIAEWGDYDIDMNLIFRWDWFTPDPEFSEPGDPDQLVIHRVLQRKAILRSEAIYITKEDEPAVREYLKPYADRMKEIWHPLAATVEEQ